MFAFPTTFLLYSNNCWATCNNACELTCTDIYHMMDEVIIPLFMNMQRILLCKESFKTARKLKVQHGTWVWRWPGIIHNSTCGLQQKRQEHLMGSGPFASPLSASSNTPHHYETKMSPYFWRIQEVKLIQIKCYFAFLRSVLPFDFHFCSQFLSLWLQHGLKYLRDVNFQIYCENPRAGHPMSLLRIREII